MSSSKHFGRRTVEQLFHHVTSAAAEGGGKGRPFIVAVDGLGGSGKTTLARSLKTRWDASGTAFIVEGDDFYANLDETYRVNLNAEMGYREYFDWRRLKHHVFLPARRGEKISYQKYDWDSAGMGEWVVVGADVDLLIVEGVYTSRPQLRGLPDVTVWVDTPTKERLRRQYGRGENSDMWIRRWGDAENYYLEYVHAFEPDDIIVSWEDTPEL